VEQGLLGTLSWQLPEQPQAKGARDPANKENSIFCQACIVLGDKFRTLLIQISLAH
jgi:hypothetical protein